jgi:hypothetical protein
MIRNDLLRDGKSQSRPGRFRRKKWIKYATPVFGRYSGSGVLDRKLDDGISVLGRDQPKGLYGCATSDHCLYRVLDQVQDYLL